MILNEQLYKNLYRSYFKGYQSDYDEDKRLFKDFYYFTTSPLYALFYAKKNDIWILSEYKLKNQINIFNARSKKDYFTLHGFLIKNNMSDKLSFLEKLKDHDWSYTLHGNDNRKDFLDIIKQLGYDGFFNYEFDEKTKKDLSQYLKAPNTDNNPAIGVLNKNIFIKVKDYTSISEALSLTQISDYKKQEIQSLENNFNFIKNAADKDTAFKVCISKANEYLVLSYNEAVALIKELYNKKLDESKKQLFKKIIEMHEKDWLG